MKSRLALAIGLCAGLVAVGGCTERVRLAALDAAPCSGPNSDPGCATGDPCPDGSDNCNPAGCSDGTNACATPDAGSNPAGCDPATAQNCPQVDAGANNCDPAAGNCDPNSLVDAGDPNGGNAPSSG